MNIKIIIISVYINIKFILNLLIHDLKYLKMYEYLQLSKIDGMYKHSKSKQYRMQQTNIMYTTNDYHELSTD